MQLPPQMSLSGTWGKRRKVLMKCPGLLSTSMAPLQDLIGDEPLSEKKTWLSDLVVFHQLIWKTYKCKSRRLDHETPILGVNIPILSMYGIYTYIYHENQPNVGKSTMAWDIPEPKRKDPLPNIIFQTPEVRLVRRLAQLGATNLNKVKYVKSISLWLLISYHIL